MNKKSLSDKLITTLGFQGLILNLLCNLCVGLLLGGTLFLLLEDNPSFESKLHAISAIIASVLVFFFSFWLLASILINTTSLRNLVEDDVLVLSKNVAKDIASEVKNSMDEESSTIHSGVDNKNESCSHDPSKHGFMSWLMLYYNKDK